jgi:hypothetical protein
MKSYVPIHRTVVSCVAQPLPTLTTEPCGGETVVVEVTVMSKVAPWVPGPITVQSDGVVLEWEGMDDGPTTTSTLVTAVSPDELFG